MKVLIQLIAGEKNTSRALLYLMHELEQKISYLTMYNIVTFI